MTRQEIEQRMDELAREYHENKDPENLAQIFKPPRKPSDERGGATGFVKLGRFLEYTSNSASRGVALDSN